MNFSDDTFTTGWEASIGATYQVMPELKVGVGFIYTCIGAEDALCESQGDLLTVSAQLPLDSYTIGLGATYAVMSNLDITLAGSWTHYIPKSYDFALYSDAMGAYIPGKLEGKYKKDVYNIGVGVGYKM